MMQTRTTYGGQRSPVKRPPGSWPTDKRYQAKRWRQTRLAVLKRDGYRCWVTGCYRLANVVDHIDRVTSAHH